VGVAVVHKEHHAGYYPGAHDLTLKLVYDRASARVLGAQGFGREGVDKRIDVVATALAGRMTVHDLAELDLAYAPPYSSANDPVNVVAMVAENDLSRVSPLVTAAGLKAELAGATQPILVDVRTLREFEQGHLPGSLHIPVDDLRFELARIPKDRRLVLYCRSGFRAHLAIQVLRAHGITDVANVTGGYLSMVAEGGFAWEAA